MSESTSKPKTVQAKTIQAEDLTPDTANANKGTERGTALLEKSVGQLGAGRSIVVDAAGRVIAGNKTLEAVAALGLRLVEVETDGETLVVVKRRDLDLTDPTGKARQLAYADNRVGEVSLEWDSEGMMADVMAGVDLGDWFTDGELEKLLREADRGQELPEDGPGVTEDDRELAYQKWKPEPGDLWALGDHRLILGDSTVPETFARLMDGERADMAFTDPPYAIYGSATGITSDIADDKMVRPFFRDILRALRANVKTFGHLYVCCDWRSYPAWHEMARSIPLPIRNVIVWDKGGGGLGSMFMQTHEFLLFLTNDPAQEVALMSHRETGQVGVYGIPNVWQFPRASGDEREHNAAKPVAYVGKAITASTKIGDIVLDPFGGSGTTIVAAQGTGRRARMVEIDIKWAAVILERYARVFNVEPVRLSNVTPATVSE